MAPPRAQGYLVNDSLDRCRHSQALIFRGPAPTKRNSNPVTTTTNGELMSLDQATRQRIIREESNKFLDPIFGRARPFRVPRVAEAARRAIRNRGQGRPQPGRYERNADD